MNTLKIKIHDVESKLQSVEQTESVLQQVEDKPSFLKALVDIEDINQGQIYPTNLEILDEDIYELE